MPNYNSDLFDAAVVQDGKLKSWVGQSDDPFFLDLRVFDLLYGGDLTETGDDTLEGFNVNTFALQVPKGALRGPKNGVIGIWNTASRPSMRVEGNDGSQTFSGKDVQVSRLGMPLVNEVVVPVGAKDYFNASKPKKDQQFLGAVNDPELPYLVNAVYPSFFPNIPDSNDNKAGIQRDDSDPGVPHRDPHAEPAEERRGGGDAQAEHGHRSMQLELLDARRHRWRRGRVPERPSLG